MRYIANCFSLLIGSLVLSASLRADESPFSGKSLAQFGTQKYKLIMVDNSSGQPIDRERGTMTMSAKLSDGSIQLTNEAKMMVDEKRFMLFRATLHCSAEGKLALRKIDSKVTRSDELVVHESVSNVADGKITQTFIQGGEGSQSREWKNGTIINEAIFFIVTRLEQKKGKTVRIKHVMAAPTNSIPKPTTQTITCLGVDEELSPAGSKLTKFVQKENDKPGIIYWVDEKKQLQRVQLNAMNRLELISESL